MVADSTTDALITKDAFIVRAIALVLLTASLYAPSFTVAGPTAVWRWRLRLQANDPAVRA